MNKFKFIFITLAIFFTSCSRFSVYTGDDDNITAESSESVSELFEKLSDEKPLVSAVIQVLKNKSISSIIDTKQGFTVLNEYLNLNNTHKKIMAVAVYHNDAITALVFKKIEHLFTDDEVQFLYTTENQDAMIPADLYLDIYNVVKLNNRSFNFDGSIPIIKLIEESPQCITFEFTYFNNSQSSKHGVTCIPSPRGGVDFTVWLIE